MTTPIDLLIEARWIIPIEPANVVLENHAVAVDKGRIVAILQQSDANTRFSPKEIKKLPRINKVPVILLTNLEQAEVAMSEEMARAIGVNDYLIKGQNTPDEIVTRAIKHLEPKK